MGILYSAQLGDYDAALEAFQRGLEHNPAEAFLVASLGSTYARIGRFDEAIAYLQQAITLQPDNAFAYSWLSILYLHLKRYDDVLAACQREIEIADDHSARRVLGYVYDRLGHYDEAIAQLEQSVTLEPEDYDARGHWPRFIAALAADKRPMSSMPLPARWQAGIMNTVRLVSKRSVAIWNGH